MIVTSIAIVTVVHGTDKIKSNFITIISASCEYCNPYKLVFCKIVRNPTVVVEIHRKPLYWDILKCKIENFSSAADISEHN